MPRRRRRWPRFVLLAVLILLAGAGLTWRNRDMASSPPAPAPAIPVEVAAAARQDVPVYLTGLGTVAAYNTVTVRTQVDGELQQIAFVEGQMVKRGDLLAVVDPRIYQAALDGAVAKTQQDQALLENAQLMLERDSKLAAQDYATRETLDTQRATVAQLQAQLAQDQAAVESAKTQLSYTSITSPIDGRTGIRLVDQGNIVHVTDTTGIVVVTQLQPISVVSTLPEEDLAAVQAALTAGPVQVTAFARESGEALATGTLLLVDNKIDQASGTLQLKSTFPNDDDALWPGQFVTLRLLARVAQDAITVPSDALQRGPDGFFVYLLRPDGTVAPQAVQPGQVADGVAVIESGLAAGDRVVTKGQYRLYPGAPVSVQTAGG